MQLYLATAKMRYTRYMSSNLSWRTAAALGSAISITAIVAFWLTQSTPPEAPGQAALTPSKGFSLELHDTARAVPPLTITDRDGNSVELVNFMDKVVLLNLWATWCAPCVRELPALDRLQKAMEGSDLVIVALSVDRWGLADVNPFWARTKLAHLEIYIDPTMGAGQVVGARGLPTTLLINRNGMEIARLEGPAEWDSEEIIAYLTILAAAN